MAAVGHLDFVLLSHLLRNYWADSNETRLLCSSQCLYKLISWTQYTYWVRVDVFEKTVTPILLYGCEVIGTGNIDILEQVQLKFLKVILNLKKSTPNCMVYGETGVMPLKIDVQCRIISYWSKLIYPTNKNLSSKLYAIVLSHFQHSISTQFRWLENVKHILISCGFSGF